MALKLPLTALAPAKVNLCLYVGGRRPDGLHEICSLFQSVTLADEVKLEPGSGAGDEVHCPGVSGPNLAANAVAAFRERFGWDGPPVRITIAKRIPVAAGLGGGSADAAAVLRLLVAASGAGQPGEELSDLAMSLGADVPSQLEPGMHLVAGAGERVKRLREPAGLALLLLGGQGELATARVYARADELGLPEHDMETLSAAIRASVEQAGGPASMTPLVHNDLEPAALDLAPFARDALTLLRGSAALAAAVSGSGPSVFGVFADRGAAERAREAISRRFGGLAAVVEAIPAGYAEPRAAPTASASRAS
jgi:4-diphosphocytidyl-2-C-methyl-D-erythritol kinase